MHIYSTYVAYTSSKITLAHKCALKLCEVQFYKFLLGMKLESYITISRFVSNNTVWEIYFLVVLRNNIIWRGTQNIYLNMSLQIIFVIGTKIS